MDETESLKYQLIKLQKINQVLMNRVERSTDWQGSAFSLFQAATVLEGQVAQRTAALRSAIEELRFAKEVAENANLSKTRFLAAASHDLLQPLNAAKLFSAALSEREIGDTNVALVTGISEALDSIDGLLRALFEISKLDAGVMNTEVGDVPLGPLLARLQREYAPQMLKAGLDFHVVPCSAVVKSDAKLLTRILWNFVSNAIRYTEQGRILLGCRRRGSTISIEVWDTGLGIPDHELEDVFQEFKQVGPPGKGRDKGMGLGLAIVERISKLLGHSVKVKSQVGKWSVFSVEVPLLMQSVTIVELPPVVADPVRKGDLSGARVVAMDDDRHGLAALNALLRTWGCKVTPIRSMVEFETWLVSGAEPPDLFIADFHLGEGVDGIGVIERMRTRLVRPIPAFIITSDRSPNLKTRVRKQCLRMLEKPIQAAKLRALMSHMLKSPGRAGE
jgi:signal transduction histidine kinase